MEVGKILGINFGPNEKAILHHISQIEKEDIELHQDKKKGSNKKTRGDVDQTV